MTPGLQQLIDQIRHMTEVDTSAIMLIKGLAHEMTVAKTDAERKAVTDAMQTETQIIAEAVTAKTQLEGRRTRSITPLDHDEIGKKKVSKPVEKPTRIKVAAKKTAKESITAKKTVAKKSSRK